MAIFINKKTNEFHLQSKKTSYIFYVMENGELGQLYYGKKIKHKHTFTNLKKREARENIPVLNEEMEDFSLDTLKQEYPGFGKGDFRYPAYQVEQENGSRITEMKYESHSIINGKKKLKGLPCSYAEQDENVQTLVITLKDEITGLTISLSYSVFEKQDIITRNTCFKNLGKSTIKLPIAMSANLDLPDSDYNLIQLSGSWARERHIVTRKITRGTQSVSSNRTASSSQNNPFLALSRENTNEFSGDVYGFNLVYSGNFLAQVEVDHYDTTRVTIGINPFDFTWTLDSQEEFQTPEVVMTFSSEGLNGMSHNFHDFYTNHLINQNWAHKERPILINNWEATYFDFDEDKIIEIVKSAKKMGVELFVLDDGWFGKRDDETTSLGDWYVDKNKLPNGLSGLAKKVKAEGVQFGLWFEPEMISTESQLFKEHPDWVIKVPSRSMTPSRYQHVLDFSRKEIIDYLYDRISEAIDETGLTYIKWDMNRHITEMYSLELSPQRQKEMGHRYILGVYDLYERLTTHYPEVLFESCASGGGRFDPGMLYYAPQTWTSDDTDAVERLKIQYGTSLVYPLSAMGSHVSAVPNHQVGRITTQKMRGDVAFFGVLGYELDTSKMTKEEIRESIEQIEFYKKHRKLLQFGKFYRLESPFEKDGNITSWMVVSDDQSTAIAGWYQILAKPNPSYQRIYFAGLDTEKSYRVNDLEEIFYGDELMYSGIMVDDLFKIKNKFEQSSDFTSTIFVIKEVEIKK